MSDNEEGSSYAFEDEVSLVETVKELYKRNDMATPPDEFGELMCAVAAES